MTKDPFTEGTKEELLKTLHENSKSGTPRFEQQKTAIFVRCIEDIEKSISDLEKSINTNASSSDKLGNKILGLNIILTLATCIASIIAIFEYFYKNN
jgi:hypothetical protein